MKWIIFACALVGAFPLGWLARKQAVLRYLLVAAVGFMPFLNLEDFSINAWSMETYRGDSKGFQITIVDLVLLALSLALPWSTRPTPFRKVRWFYLGVAAISMLLAAMPLYSAFGVWKILRAYFLVAVLWRALQHDLAAAPWLLRGLAGGVVYSLLVALEQRYLGGLYQVQANFDHPNSLGMAVNLIAPVGLALLLAGEGGFLAAALVACGAACVVLTLSRGSLVMFALVSGLVFVGSAVRGITRRKVWIFAISTAGALAILAYSLDSIIERFIEAPEASAHARELFVQAGRQMWADNPLGVGINNYSYMLGHGGYGEAVGLPAYDHHGIAHHIYWLTLAELGPLGLLAYVLTLLVPFGLTLRPLVRATHDVRGDVLLGLGAGLAVTALHGNAEWVARQTPMTYFVWTAAVLIAALASQIRDAGGDA